MYVVEKISWVHGQVLDLVGTFDFMTKDYCKLPYKAFNVKNVRAF